jgi:SAM-dependent methyltransferase
VDLSHEQLLSALRCQRHLGPAFPIVEADGERLPLAARSCDLVVSEYGASLWCDPQRWLAEAARILRPGGRLVFLTNSVLASLCVPADGGYAGDRLLRGQRDVRRVRWPGGGVEYHPGHGELLALLVRNGFIVESLHELYAPEGAGTPAFYDVATAQWASQWPVEDLWVARLDYSRS